MGKRHKLELQLNSKTLRLLQIPTDHSKRDARGTAQPRPGPRGDQTRRFKKTYANAGPKQTTHTLQRAPIPQPKPTGPIWQQKPNEGPKYETKLIAESKRTKKAKPIVERWKRTEPRNPLDE